MQTITAKYAGRCRGCGHRIQPGDSILWSRDLGTYCGACSEHEAEENSIETPAPVPVETPHDTSDPLVRAIWHLAGNCDHAATHDGQGFGSYDVEFGHSLANANPWTAPQRAAAERLAIKYRKQIEAAGILPPDLADRVERIEARKDAARFWDGLSDLEKRSAVIATGTTATDLHATGHDVLPFAQQTDVVQTEIVLMRATLKGKRTWKTEPDAFRAQFAGAILEAVVATPAEIQADLDAEIEAAVLAHEEEAYAKAEAPDEPVTVVEADPPKGYAIPAPTTALPEAEVEKIAAKLAQEDEDSGQISIDSLISGWATAMEYAGERLDGSPRQREVIHNVVRNVTKTLGSAPTALLETVGDYDAARDVLAKFADDVARNAAIVENVRKGAQERGQGDATEDPGPQASAQGAQEGGAAEGNSRDLADDEGWADLESYFG